jgi:hypothetical protein
MSMFIGVSMGVRGCDEILDPSGCCGWERPGKGQIIESASTITTNSPTYRTSSWSTAGSDNSDKSREQNKDIGETQASLKEFHQTCAKFDQLMSKVKEDEQQIHRGVLFGTLFKHMTNLDQIILRHQQDSRSPTRK